MFAVLLGLPTWLKAAIAGIALLGVLQVRHFWEVRGLKAQIATLTAERDAERAATVELRVGLSDVQANRDMLAARMREQSRAIDLQQAHARQADAQSALAAARVVAVGRQLSEALRATTAVRPLVAPGHEAMNRWLQEQFER